MMKKRNYTYLLMSLLMLSTTGCGMEVDSNNGVEISEVVFAETEKETPIPTATPTTAPTVTPSEEQEEVVIINLEEIEKKRKAFVPEELNPFNQFNQLLSRDIDESPSVFWFDENTGVSYFVNRESDYYIYQLKDGKAELVVDIPAQELCMYDGLLYFMVENYDNRELTDIKLGDIYCYNPTSNTVELVYAVGAMDENAIGHELTVNENGIYFSYKTENEKTKTETIMQLHEYHLPFGETEPVEDKLHMTNKGWENYYITYMPKLSLISRTAGTKDKKEFPMIPFRYCVIGDKLYSVSLGSSAVSCINLRTGEEIEYDFGIKYIDPITEAKYIPETLVVFHSFIITETEIWAAGTSELYRMDLESGEKEYYYFPEESSNSSYILPIEGLYTDGTELYVELNVKRTGLKRKLARLLTEETNKDSFGRTIMAVEYVLE